MSAEPAHGHGRDEDPAARAPEPADVPADEAPADEAPAVPAPALPGPGPAPVPADSDPGAPAPVPDWLDAVGWAASAAAREDEAEPDDPDLEDGPPDFAALAAIAAEAREISATEARDRAYAARLSVAGGFGVVGAAPGRRGPGQPGSAKTLPGESSSPAAAFGSGLVLDRMPGCAGLLDFAAAAAGPDGSFPGASEDEIVGVICALDRVQAHAAARVLDAVAEFIRRRPAEGAAVDEDSGLPEMWHEYAVEELAWALGETKAAAEALLSLAHDLAGKLPGTRAALDEGIISGRKAEIIALAAHLLDKKEAARAEALVLGRAGRLTPPGLRAAIARAVMEVAPAKARKRREEAARDARVQRWPEDSGNAALAGRELPPAEVLAADQRITALAKELRAAGLDGDMDQLRARAYLDLLLGIDSRPGPAPAGQGQPATDSATDPATDGTPASTDGDSTTAGQHQDGGPEPGGAGSGGSSAGPADPTRSAGPGDGGRAGVLPPGFAGRINLIVPLATALGLADRPGQAGTLGPVDPWLARDLIRSAAANPNTTWCLTITDPDGHAIGHGCAKSRPRAHAADPPEPDTHGPPGESGTWRLLADILGRPDLAIAIHPIAAGSCDHRFQAPGHDPGAQLRHLTEIRHAMCTAPGCRSPASACDFEHNTPFEDGGRTCLCNGGPKCRRHHRLKQHPRWTVEQPTPATLRWITPAGRMYVTEATRYPI